MIQRGTKIAIFGLGHMGLPTAALFACNGLSVLGVARNNDRIKMINQGKSPIMEHGLEERVKEAVSSGNLRASKNGIKASKLSKIMIVLVPTPKDKENASDLSAVKSVCENIAEGLDKNDLVIIESTVPPGTCENVVVPILERSGLKAGADFSLAYTPERALPNNTIYEMTHNARVIGGIDKKSTENAVDLYERITEGDVVKVKDIMTAEMVKLMENTYRDTNIALANEMAVICESLGVDAIEAIKAANYHPRVNIHSPGPGVGGHCLSIDPYFIVEVAEKIGEDANLIKTSRKINNMMPEHVENLILDALLEAGKSIKGSKIGILGVAYKAEVADARETPAEPLIKKLIKDGAKVYAHDPYVDKRTIRSFGAEVVEIDEVLNSDCVVLVTDHDDYKNLNSSMIKNDIFVCTRPIFDPEEFKRNNTIFKGIGRI